MVTRFGRISWKAENCFVESGLPHNYTALEIHWNLHSYSQGVFTK